MLLGKIRNKLWLWWMNLHPRSVPHIFLFSVSTLTSRDMSGSSMIEMLLLAEVPWIGPRRDSNSHRSHVTHRSHQIKSHHSLPGALWRPYTLQDNWNPPILLAQSLVIIHNFQLLCWEMEVHGPIVSLVLRFHFCHRSFQCEPSLFPTLIPIHQWASCIFLDFSDFPRLRPCIQTKIRQIVTDFTWNDHPGREGKAIRICSDQRYGVNKICPVVVGNTLDAA